MQISTETLDGLTWIVHVGRQTNSAYLTLLGPLIFSARLLLPKTASIHLVASESAYTLQTVTITGYQRAMLHISLLNLILVCYNSTFVSSDMHLLLTPDLRKAFT